MIDEITLEDFLSRNRLERATWEKSELDWTSLKEIGIDHEQNTAKLLQSAELFARLIQTFNKVHSVRWRVKDTHHLLEKIVRKCAEGSDKYKGINKENYYSIVTDLVGVRALHLFKNDCFEIDSALCSSWTSIEKPVAYIRAGDGDELTKSFCDHGFEIKNHPAGYRSVHYVFESQPLQRKVITEVQVRTIFEEAWSEIDHKVRYPNFSDNELVGYFLTIFNRLSGSADEMGSFVQSLTGALDGHQMQIDAATLEKNNAINAMEAVVAELEKLKKQDRDSKANIAKLRSELDKLKRASTPAVGPAQGLTIPSWAEHLNNIDYEKINKRLDSIKLPKAAEVQTTVKLPTIDTDAFIKLVESFNKKKS
ncbi:MAG: RelA/SpoT domain-containing protein [Moraxellaceae bacterium]|nr:RelA/SpoT domain-containing protein [Moraxellaceae bacterium]